MPFVPTLGPSGGQIPSGVADIRVTVNEAEFNGALERYLVAFKTGAEDAVIKTALELLGRIQMKTPTDTFRCKNSFHAVLPGQRDNHFAYKDILGKTWEGALGEAAARDVIRGEYEAIVGTNVFYAIFLEAGHSRQAPSGMVAVSVAEMTSALDAAVEKALNEAGQGF